MVLTSNRVEVPLQLSLRSKTKPARASSRARLALASLRCRRSTGVSPTAAGAAAALPSSTQRRASVAARPLTMRLPNSLSASEPFGPRETVDEGGEQRSGAASLSLRKSLISMVRMLVGMGTSAAPRPLQRVKTSLHQAAIFVPFRVGLDSLDRLASSEYEIQGIPACSP